MSQPGHDHKGASITRRFRELKIAGIAGMVYLADHDEAGLKKAEQLVRCAEEAGFSLLVLHAKDVWPGVPEKGSIDDAPGTAADRVEALLEAIEAGKGRNLFRREVECTEDPFQADDRPPDLQAADLLYQFCNGHVACVANTLFRYDSEKGCWTAWSDADARNEAQGVLRKMFRLVKGKDGTEQVHHPFGRVQQCRDAVDSLKVKARPGPLQSPSPPPVIVFGNGTFNLQTCQLEPHSPSHGATYRIDADYLPKAACPPALHQLIINCFPEGSKPIIRALIRWAIDPTIRYGEAFHLLGDTGTGKGALITFVGSLLPAAMRPQISHPAYLDSPERLHQYVLGRRLVLFPDTPSRVQGCAHCGLFYELIENAPQTTRKLHAGEAEQSRPMFARCLLGSVAPLQFSDGRDGYLRRIRTLKTLPRTGDPNLSLRADLEGTTEEHRAIRSSAVSWSLAMPLTEVEAVLDGKDPEGLLREAAGEAAASSDTVSQWADACLVPHPIGPDEKVDSLALSQMYEAYVGWCRYAGVQHGMQKINFLSQLRKVLGLGRCLPRRKEAMAEARARGATSRDERSDIQRFDAGFALRPGVLRGLQEGHNQQLGDRHTFNRMALGSEGLRAIAVMPQARRPDLRHSPDPPSPAGGSSSGPNAGKAEDSPATRMVSQGMLEGVGRGVVRQSSSPRTTVVIGFLPSSDGVSQGSPTLLRKDQGTVTPEKVSKDQSLLSSNTDPDCPATPSGPVPHWFCELAGLVSSFPDDAAATLALKLDPNATGKPSGRDVRKWLHLARHKAQQGDLERLSSPPH